MRGICLPPNHGTCSPRVASVNFAKACVQKSTETLSASTNLSLSDSLSFGVWGAGMSETFEQAKLFTSAMCAMDFPKVPFYGRRDRIRRRTLRASCDRHGQANYRHPYHTFHPDSSRGQIVKACIEMQCDTKSADWHSTTRI